EFWFCDGSIVLIVLSRRTFPVYQRVLSQNSVVFRDLFTLAQPIGNMIDGWPIVHLSDSEEDVPVLLSSM
ncbi:hypothetical protein BKA93DRAFT_709757, partial [Sparassis latifolia]